VTSLRQSATSGHVLRLSEDAVEDVANDEFDRETLRGVSAPCKDPRLVTERRRGVDPPLQSRCERADQIAVTPRRFGLTIPASVSPFGHRHRSHHSGLSLTISAALVATRQSILCCSFFSVAVPSCNNAPVYSCRVQSFARRLLPAAPACWPRPRETIDPSAPCAALDCSARGSHDSSTRSDTRPLGGVHLARLSVVLSSTRNP